MKKRIWMLAVLTCTAFSFTSCGGSGSEQQQSTPNETSIETEDGAGNQPGADMDSDTTGKASDTTEADL